MPGILIVDNNCLDRLEDPEKRTRLAANLRATGRDLWPTAVNVLEALKSRDAAVRTRLLLTLSELAQDRLPLTLPGEVLRRLASAFGTVAKIDWCEPKLSRFFRYPESVTEEDARRAREHLDLQESGFARAHGEATGRLRPKFKEAGGHRRWQSAVEFIEEVWLSPPHLQGYIDGLWDYWNLGKAPDIETVLRVSAWRLFFESWGASVYAQQIQHPQRGHVQHGDIMQLVYLGLSHSRLLATDDIEFRALANSVLKGRHARAEVVPLNDLLR